MKLRGTWTWIVALVICPWACGGGASVEDVCQKVVACDDSQTFEECVEETEALEQLAEDAGCGDAIDDFIDCADDTLECVEGEVRVDCDSEMTEVALCAQGISGRECGYGCDGDGSCFCSVGPNTDQACCEEGTSCEASLTCQDDCCE